MIDLVLVHAGELITGAGRGETAEELGVIEDGALLVEEGRVSWVGTTRELRRRVLGKARRTLDAEGCLVTPGLVDAHTHLLFAGSREDELERKASGESYISILQGGGGILKTIQDTRAASTQEIVKQSNMRLTQLLKNGVTTAEVKTGYGQDIPGELKMLEAIRRLRVRSSVELVPTFLGLHAHPPEFKGVAEYVDFAIRKMLPAAASAKSRPSFSDCFCEDGVFAREDCEKYLKASKSLGFALKVHADEFADSGGASLGAELGCVSADHLGGSNSTGIRAMALKGVTAVLLPGTSLCTSIPYADARGIIGAGCHVALGTDLSPNSWIESPQLVMSLACNAMKMTPSEALLGFTKYAAKAIGRDDLGSLVVGSPADLVLHTVPSYRFIPYRLGGQYVQRVFKSGKQVYEAEGD